MNRFFAAILLTCLAGSPVLASSTPPERFDFIEKKAEGWFWYQDDPTPPEKKKPEPKKKPKPNVVVIKPPEKPEEPKEEAPKGPAPLSAAWLTENLPKYLNMALDDPSRENITAYMYLQRLAVDKSQRFSDGMQAAVVGDPYLDESARRPLSTFGAQVLNEESNKHTKAVLASLSEKVGIWFFFKSDCPQSEVQVRIQEKLKSEYGLSTYPISLDGAGLRSGAFPEFVVDKGHSEKLSVVSTPAMFLVHPASSGIVPLGQGAVALDEMEKRVLVAATSAGWLTPEDYQRTRPMQGPVLDPKALEGMDEKDIQNPMNIIQILRENLSRQ